MEKNIRILSMFLFLFSVCMAPVRVCAGQSDFQSRIKTKIGGSKNIQYNLDVLDRSDYDQQIASPVASGRVESMSQGGMIPGDVAVSRELEAGAYKKSQKPSEEMSASSVMPVLSAYAIYKAEYKAEIEEDVATVSGKVLFEVFKKGWTQIPLLRSNIGLIEASVNRGASFVTMQNGRYYLMIDRPGRYNLEIEFLVKASRERENGPGNFSFEVLPAPISQFEFIMPETGVDIFVDPSIRVEVKQEPNRTVAWAVMPNTQLLTVRWTKALPKETITPVKLEPKVYADATTYASVGDGLIRCQTTLSYSILQSEISMMRIALPEDTSVLEVQGNDLRDWKVSAKEGMQYLDVYLNFGIKGAYALYLNYERKVVEGSGVVEVPWVRAQGVEREKGYLGVAAATNVELAVNKLEHASLIDIKELPSSIWSRSANPILLAFKYLSHPFNIAIEVTKHEELPVLVAAIDSAEYTTLVTDEGKSLSKAIYQVRNNVKQFLRMALPKDATLWSVFVAGKPVKPAKDKSGSILIPLEKSQLSGESLTQFPVEVVYLDKTSKMKFLGSFALHLPNTDIPASSLGWLLFLPYEYGYWHFGGDVKKSDQVAGLADQGMGYRKSGSLVDKKRVAAEFSKSSWDLRQQVSSQAPQQILGEDYAQGEARAKGVLPIRIDIPNSGRVYQFTKLLVTENESPWLGVWYVYGIKQVQGLFWFIIKFIFFLALFMIVLRWVRRLFKKNA